MSAGIDDKPGDDGPTRPTNLPHARPSTIQGPPGPLDKENAAANERFKRNSEALEQRRAEWQLPRQPGPGDKDKRPGPTQEASAQQQDAAPAKARTLTFAADRAGSSRSYADLKREQAAATPAKGDGRTLTFAPDRGGKGQGRDGR